MNKGVRSGVRFIGFVFALVSLFVLGAVGAFGQAIDGNVVGTVTDTSGAAVVGADVTTTNIATGVTDSGKTGASGDYRFDHLLVGTYRITVKMTGFKTISEQIDVELNKTSTRNITLQPGATSETVEVSGTPPAIDTTTSQLQTTYSETLLQDLPVTSIGTGVLNASLLQAGVGSTGGLGAGSGPSVGGQRPRENNFTIEGTDNNDKGVTGPLVYVPNDAVANFTVIQNQFSPEFGHSAGGQFNQVIVNGTNTIHGRVYEYFQNRNLNALDQSFANEGVYTIPRYDNNRFGGQVGGPIVKNKLFYFANFEYNPIGQAGAPASQVFAPTAAGWQSILSLGDPTISANNVNGYAKYATASAATSTRPVTNTVTDTTANIPVGVLQIVAPSYQNGLFLTTSMDYDMTDKDQIRGRYIYNKYTSIDTGAMLPVFFTGLRLPFHLVTLAEYHTFGPTLGNEFRVGFNRNANDYTVPDVTFPGLDAFPNLTIDNLGNLNVGPDPNAPQYAVQNTYQLQDNVSWTKANHDLRFGIDLRKQIDPQLFIQRARGDYDWATLDSYVHDQVPDFGQRSFGSAGYSGDDYMIGWYVNDIWKIRPNVSLNLGVRYEYLSVPAGWKQQSLNSIADLPGLITFGVPQAPKHDFMPRVGFAYSPGRSGNTSIRGGFSMGYDVLYDNIGTLSRPPQIGSTANCPSSYCQTPFLANGGIPPQQSSGISVLDQATARANTSSYLTNEVKYPYSESWNFGVQHVFANVYTAEVRYVGSRGVDLPTQNILDFVAGANPASGYNVPTFITAPSQAQIDALTTVYRNMGPSCTDPKNPTTLCPSGVGDMVGSLYYGYWDTGTGPGGFYDPNYLDNGFYSPITGFMPWGASTYHGLQTQVQRRMTNGLQFQAAWTWSHFIDNSTADFFSTVIAPRRPQDFRNLPAERANSILDHAHRITIETAYDVPWFAHDSNWFKKNLLGNYEFIPIFTWESGQWGTVQSGVDSNLNADSAPDRAIYNAAGIKGTGSNVNAIYRTDLPNCSEAPGCIVGWVAQNSNAQYIVAGQGSVATSSRNTLSTPPINNFDITAAKHFNLGERYRIDFMAQAFNLFNHPQFVPGYINDVASFANTTVRNYFIPSNPNFNIPRLNFSSSPRTMQLALKFSF